jgi:hypothetical protein
LGQRSTPEPLVAVVELSVAGRIQEKEYLLEHVCRIYMMLREKRERGTDTGRDDREREAKRQRKRGR